MDPVTFEILRHRLWAINEEAATTVKRVSASSLANEANDFNTAIMDKTGDVVAVANYSISKATTMSAVVKDILAEYQKNPGINPGDAFICNDVYVAVQHQNDVAFVMPYFDEGVLLGWVGAEIHQVDVGGPNPGNVQVGARDIWGEAPLIPPLKIVESGVIRRDVEREYLRRSRTPDLLALDLRAQLAACNVTCRRLGEIVAQYDAKTVDQLMSDVLTYTDIRFKSRLRELPDGTWRHTTFVDFDGDIYPIRVAMTKSGESLKFDLRGSARQAPATVNCTLNSLIAVIRGYVCICLCWDMPWSPSAVGRSVEIVTDSGTLVDCEWPAGVSKSSTSVAWPVGKTVGHLIGRMLACSDRWRDKAMSSWQGSMAGEDIFGVTDDGHAYGTTLIDALAGAGGARTFADGIDTGGYLASMGISIANVETYELNYPILYLTRRQRMDGGGAGEFRGGVSIFKLFTVHGTGEIPEFIVHSNGTHMPMSGGTYGGYPGGVHQLFIKRDTNILERFRQGDVPQSLADLSGTVWPVDQILRTQLALGDVYMCAAMGAGGYGDPLDRLPSMVMDDVRNGLVSITAARETYGVDIREMAVSERGTKVLRKEMTLQRRSEWTDPNATSHANVPLLSASETRTVMQVGPHLRLLRAIDTQRLFVGCRCGAVLSPVGANYKEFVPVRKQSPIDVDPARLADGVHDDRFEIREYFCPGCSTLLEVDVALKDAPVEWDLDLRVHEPSLVS